MTTVVIVGEMNPYGQDPRYALFDLPVGASGWRLRTKVLQVDRTTYFGFKRHNLCVGKYSVPDAWAEAGRLYLSVYDSRRVDAVFLLLGRKVAAAFGWGSSDPFTVDGRVVVLPHPSGRNRVWNDPKSFLQVQHILREAAPMVPWGEIVHPQRSSDGTPDTG